jgi:hypothetical protein
MCFSGEPMIAIYGNFRSPQWSIIGLEFLVPDIQAKSAYV